MAMGRALSAHFLIFVLGLPDHDENRTSSNLPAPTIWASKAFGWRPKTLQAGRGRREGEGGTSIENTTDTTPLRKDNHKVEKLLTAHCPFSATLLG